MRLNARTAEVSVEKYRESIVSRENDLLAIEEPLEIRINQTHQGTSQSHILTLTMRTPGQDKELGLGFLFAEGIITSTQDVLHLEEQGISGRDKPFPSRLMVTLDAHVSFDLAKLQRNFFSTSSCGVCGRLSLDHLPDKRAHQCDSPSANSHRSPLLSAALLHQLPARIDLQQNLFRHTGSIHAAALFDARGNLLHLSEDVGRHNAMDKLVGKIMMQQSQPHFEDKIVLFSGRVSYELVQKAVMAGIPVIAAIGAPSSLAVEIARSYNITLIGFLRDRRFNVYSVPERVVEI